MKARAILFASVLLVGCQGANKNDARAPQHAQSLSTGSLSEAGKPTGRETYSRWLDDGSFLAQDDNLWSSISNQLEMEIPDNIRVREQKQKYLSNKSYLHDVSLRAEPYMYWIAGQVKQRNLPMELVLLPIVESAFDPHATSSANAAGIWQFIPSTGRNYGLKQTQAYDGRRDIVASTTAALDMMQRLNKMFDGDWLLTVAAFNSGEGRVMNAIKKNKAQGKPTDFWSLSLPQETKLYIPKMLALSDIFQNSKRYGIRLPSTDENRALARVEVNDPVKLAQIAEVTGMSLKKLKTFNAGVKNATVGQSNQQYVMVPKRHAQQLRTSLAAGDIPIAQVAKETESSNHASPAASKLYKVRSGDTLSTIASRHGVSSKSLQAWNNLPNSRLKVGQTLKLESGNRRVAANSSTRLAANNSITYKVRKGDSLSSIAKRHGLNTKDLLRWNNGKDLIKPGDQLTLFVKSNRKPAS
ncbi:murein transglycosylase D [uncultured Cedecea sp.]|uniref:murein transglycosylase D n=1 Tax=uncultured Cedecea sp. TaxID=988762 RepID=UPI00261D174C|nr:murein transglycosylase D [uncultured Cedecea sp.]